MPADRLKVAESRQAPRQICSQPTQAKAKVTPTQGSTQTVDNQPFDLAVEVNDSEEIDSDEEGDEVNVGGP